MIGNPSKTGVQNRRCQESETCIDTPRNPRHDRICDHVGRSDKSQPQNGRSDFTGNAFGEDTISKIFGNIGMHSRAAVSSNSLPLGVAVEVDAIFELN